MKQRIPKAIYSKEFHEQAVKQVTEEGLSAKGSGATSVVASIDPGEPGKSGASRLGWVISLP